MISQRTLHNNYLPAGPTHGDSVAVTGTCVLSLSDAFIRPILPVAPVLPVAPGAKTHRDVLVPVYKFF